MYLAETYLVSMLRIEYQREIDYWYLYYTDMLVLSFSTDVSIASTFSGISFSKPFLLIRDS